MGTVGEAPLLPAAVPFPSPAPPFCFPRPFPFPFPEEAPSLAPEVSKVAGWLPGAPRLEPPPLAISLKEAPAMEVVWTPFSFGELNRKLQRAELSCKSCCPVSPSDKVTYLFPPLEWPEMLSAKAKAGAASRAARRNARCFFFTVLLLGPNRFHCWQWLRHGSARNAQCLFSFEH